ncbi:hypothetical protein PsunGV_gp089 [Pseudalatia unipuncta granulovirus]|jgi:hypothetical protein|uniref:Uncharacterized protein n=1 Tax=Pseudalatia unipuncta granulosis virus TaxID=36355 RepID=B6S6V9_GVPU|nr:hypothetical protein PsunGV_gp089 [Pseudalatia unipuncta granulovirus]ACH69439.1 unknown [Pseudalatia unipuncta granulovirus]
MKRHAPNDNTARDVYAKVAKIEDNAQDLRQLILYRPEPDNVQFKLYCVCAVPCDTLIVCVHKENAWKIEMSLFESHNFIKYQSVFRRYYAQLLRLLLSLNMPVGKTLVQVYVYMC